MEVTVYQNQVERALKVLKRQLTKDGLLKELKRRRFYEKPSLKKETKAERSKEEEKSGNETIKFFLQDVDVVNSGCLLPGEFF